MAFSQRRSADVIGGGLLGVVACFVTAVACEPIATPPVPPPQPASASAAQSTGNALADGIRCPCMIRSLRFSVCRPEHAVAAARRASGEPLGGLAYALSWRHGAVAHPVGRRLGAPRAEGAVLDTGVPGGRDRPQRRRRA